ncbi:hypothetical protein NLM33_18550 [Bradyrhizobium sp. CCGUVB1N3]|uniref:hypothetical protein n=1 Tax=Bradyrhizobium sp. CCGUVB1N3 TaxID=2949629 RepID=UPI0020B3B61A|nr:hypothetical protein [Bradyrhizobium sp. CCGUVB1N3]MCP3472319.1 hypothetical protein [Bradyrhizobium sp. CCGUVB1N3]
MIVANDFAAALVGLTPSRRHSKIVKPRLQHNPAGIHLIFAGRCPNNRGQLCPKEFRAGRRVLISVESAQAWLRARELEGT